MPKVVSVINMKGGVGKTTVSAHVFRVLYHKKHCRVLLVDVDAQFNLTQCVMTQGNYNSAVNSNSTIMRCFEPTPAGDFFSVKKSTTPPPKASDIAVKLRNVGDGKSARLDLIAGNFQIVKYSLGSGLIGHSQKRTVAARAMAEKKTVGHRS